MSQQIVLENKFFDLVRVKDGIYAAIVKEGTIAVGNSGFVELADSVVVFDAFNSQLAAEALREAVADLTGKPVSHLVNSHWHGDHVRGNQAFRDAVIVSTERTRGIMAERHPERIARQRDSIGEVQDTIRQLEQQLSTTVDGDEAQGLAGKVSFLKDFEETLKDLELTLPTETFSSTWMLENESLRLQCLTYGGGHTESDAFMYIPDAKVIFVGDLVAVQNHMLVVDGNVGSWITILQRLSDLDFDYLIPGHGPVGGPEWISAAVDYLQDLLDTAESLRKKGMFADDLDTVAMPQKYQAWAADAVFYQNLRHLLQDRDIRG